MAEHKSQPRQKELRYKAGEIIFLEGEISDGLYVLKSGEIEVLKNGSVISHLSGDELSLYGEMSYLLGQRRSASLRAKTDVVAVRITAGGDCRDLIRSIPEKVMELMRTLATRLDLMNQELQFHKVYKEFYEACLTQAQDPEISKFVKNISEQVEIAKNNRKIHLVREYLLTPRIWGIVKESLVETIAFYIKENPEPISVEEYSVDEAPWHPCSWIDFRGEMSGGMALFMDKPLIEKITFAFGVKNGDEAMLGETSKELSNQILAQVKNKASTFKVQMSTPCLLPLREDLTQKIGGLPALDISFKTSYGHLSLIFQIRAES